MCVFKGALILCVMMLTSCGATYYIHDKPDKEDVLIAVGADVQHWDLWSGGVTRPSIPWLLIDRICFIIPDGQEIPRGSSGDVRRYFDSLPPEHVLSDFREPWSSKGDRSPGMMEWLVQAVNQAGADGVVREGCVLIAIDPPVVVFVPSKSEEGLTALYGGMTLMRVIGEESLTIPARGYVTSRSVAETTGLQVRRLPEGHTIGDLLRSKPWLGQSGLPNR